MSTTFSSARIFHFSGTGASALLAQGIKTFLQTRGLSASLVSLASPKSRLAASIAPADSAPATPAAPANQAPASAEKPGLLEIYVFPVHAFAAPDPCISYVRHLARTANPALVVACHGGGPLGAAESFARRLESRGRHIVGILSPQTPAQWTQVGEVPRPETVKPMLQAALAGVQESLARLIDHPGQPLPEDPWKVSALTGGIMRVVSFLYRKLGRHALGLLFSASPDCNSCAICANGCPAGCITMKNRPAGARPVWHLNCTLCNHCINICPTQAIQCTWVRLLSLLGINTLAFAGFILAAFQGWPGILAGAAGYLLVTFLQLTLGNRFLAFLESRAKAGSWLLASWTTGVSRYMAPKTLD